MLERTLTRQAFGKYLCEHGSCRELIADSASDLEAARLLTLACAEDIDRLGARGARGKIALIKVRSITTIILGEDFVGNLWMVYAYFVGTTKRSNLFSHFSDAPSSCVDDCARADFASYR